MSNQIVISSGAKLRGLNGVITGTTGVLDSVPLGGANGVATLDSSGKVPVSQLPSSVVTYLGTWNAATNTPTLANGTGDAGDMYLCNVAGTVNFGAGPITFAVGDWVLYGSGTWQKSNGQNGTVTSVAVTESGDALTITGSPITTAGTINIGFAGTSAQYVAGDGSLITFPSVITEAQNLITEVYNETGATLTKGTVVYINGGHGNLPTITKALATSDATSAQTYGVVRTDITNNNNGYVVVIGRLTDLDTQAYSTGAQLYLSSTTAGAWTTTKQYAPAHLVYVGIVTRSHPTQGVVEVKIQNGYELDELHNVSAQTPSNNDGLFYNSSNSLWENKSIATALGYTPANDSLVVHLAGTETITGNKTFSNATKNNGGILLENGSSFSASGYMNLGGMTDGLRFTSGLGISNYFALPSATGYTFTFPNASGTLALTSNLSSYVPYSGATTDVLLGSWALYSAGVQVTDGGLGVISTDGWLSASKGIFLTDTASGGNWSTGITNITARTAGLLITHNAGGGILNFNTSTTYTYNFPAADGTIALTSNLSSYLPLSGGTLTGALNGTSIALTGTAGDSLLINHSVTRGIRVASSGSGYGIIINNITGATSIPFTIQQNGAASITLNANGSADFAGALNGTSATFTSGVTIGNYDGQALKMQSATSTGSSYLRFYNSAGTSRGYLGLFWSGSADYMAYDSGALQMNFNSSNSFTFTGGGAATFSSSVTANGTVAIKGSNALYLYNTDNTTISAILNGGASGVGDMSFYTGGSQKMILNSSGNVGIGTSSPLSYTSYTTAQVSNTAGALMIVESTSGSILGQLVADNGYSGGASVVLGARSNHPLVFTTNNTERLRITASGVIYNSNPPANDWANVIYGNSTASQSYGLRIQAGSNSSDISFKVMKYDTSTTFYVRGDGYIFAPSTYYFTTGGGANMHIASDGSLNRSVSSIKYKKNVKSYTKGLAEVMKMKPVTYNSINENETHTYAGLIAEDIHDLGLTEFVQYAEDGTPDALAYQNMVALLVKAIQELKAEIDELKNK